MANDLQTNLFQHLKSLHKSLEKYENMINLGEGDKQYNLKMIDFYMGEIKVVREKLFSVEKAAAL